MNREKFLEPRNILGPTKESDGVGVRRRAKNTVEDALSKVTSGGCRAQSTETKCEKPGKSESADNAQNEGKK